MNSLQVASFKKSKNASFECTEHLSGKLTKENWDFRYARRYANSSDRKNEKEKKKICSVQGRVNTLFPYKLIKNNVLTFLFKEKYPFITSLHQKYPLCQWTSTLYIIPTVPHFFCTNNLPGALISASDVDHSKHYLY